MCRVLLGKKETIMKYEEKYNTLNLLSHLMLELGGHGNGLVLIQDKRIIYNKKGVNYSLLDIYDSIIKEDYDYCIFHTRLASIGEISDKNCHPFVYNNTCLAMNGTMSEYIDYTYKDNITDTEYLFNKIKTIDNINKFISVLKKKTPTFIGCVNGLPFVVKNLNMLNSWKLDKDDILFASSFPKDIVERETISDNNFSWQEA